MKVRAYHNIRPARDSAYGTYRSGEPLVCVFQADIATQDDTSACEFVFRLLNVGDDPEFGTPDDRAVEYRARRNRSLSVGDVAEIDGRFYACASIGWAPVEPPAVVLDVAVPGSTPIADKA